MIFDSELSFIPHFKNITKIGFYHLKNIARVYVSMPTHSRGHTLDVLISKGVVISNVDVVDVALSDHFCVFFVLSLTPKPAVGSAVVRGGLLNDRTGTQFMEMIRFENTLCSNVDGLLNSYTSSLLNVLDTIAPVKVKMVKSRQRAPWRREAMAQKRKPNGNGASQNSRFIMRFTKKSYVCSTRLCVEQGRVIFLKSSKTAVITLVSCLLQ